jgi:hypothetical protein
VNSIVARATLISLFLVLIVVTQGHTEDYYIYQTANGDLVISNKQPPPGRKVIKQLPGETDKEVPPAARASDQWTLPEMWLSAHLDTRARHHSFPKRGSLTHFLFRAAAGVLTYELNGDPQ